MNLTKHSASFESMCDVSYFGITYESRKNIPRCYLGKGCRTLRLSLDKGLTYPNRNYPKTCAPLSSNEFFEHKDHVVMAKSSSRSHSADLSRRRTSDTLAPSQEHELPTVIYADDDHSFSWIASLPVKASCFGGRMRWHTQNPTRKSTCASVSASHIISFVHQHQDGVVCVFARREPRSNFIALSHALGCISLCREQGLKQLVRLNRSGLALEVGELPSVQFLREMAKVFTISTVGCAICPGTDRMALKVARMAGYIFGMFSVLQFHVFEDDREMVQSVESLNSRYFNTSSSSRKQQSSWASPSDDLISEYLLRRIGEFLEPGEKLCDALAICGLLVDSTGSLDLGLARTPTVSESQYADDKRLESSGMLDEGTRSNTKLGVDLVVFRKTPHSTDRGTFAMEKIPEEDGDENDR